MTSARRSKTLLVGGLLALASCRARDLPALGQAHVRLSTDAPVPAVVARVRLDVYAEDGRWLASRDASVREPSAWPISFTVFSSDPSSPARIRVRIRGYREGALRDYRGERYVPPPPPGAAPGALPPEPALTEEPRLLEGGSDVTPRDEPIPASAIDRLTWVTLAEGVVREVPLTLHLACAGTMADVARDRTCEDTRDVLVPTRDAAVLPPEATDAPSWRERLEDELRRLPSPRAAGRAESGTPLHDEQVRVPGGVLVLGSRAETASTYGPFQEIQATPERVFVVPPLLVDRFEVTVARFRDALRRGFSVPPESVIVNERSELVDGDPLGEGLCTFSSSPLPGAASREELPLTCIGLAAARAFCAFDGGSLPTEAEWEWLATSEGRATKTTFPWGEEPPRCEDAAYGRAVVPQAFSDLTPCGASPKLLGPAPVTAGARDETPSGVHGLTANVAEWIDDAFQSFASACWANASFYGPECRDPSAALVLARGSTWVVDTPLPPVSRVAFTMRYGNDLGFRCVTRPR